MFRGQSGKVPGCITYLIARMIPILYRINRYNHDSGY